MNTQQLQCLRRRILLGNTATQARPFGRSLQTRHIAADLKALVMCLAVHRRHGIDRQRQSPAARGLDDSADGNALTLWRAQATVAYEVDLFGRVAASVDAASATAQQREALFRSLQLALQADVAQTYFLIRELDAEQALYTGTVQLRTETLRLVQRRFDEGDVSELELARAKTELASAQSESFGVARRRANAEHALALLLGRAPADFSLPPHDREQHGAGNPHHDGDERESLDDRAGARLSIQPERFLDGAPPVPKGAWIPFGLGPRVCIGQHFAMLEMTLLAAMLLQRYRLRFICHSTRYKRRCSR